MTSDLRVRQKIGNTVSNAALDRGVCVCLSGVDTIQGIRVAIKIPHSQYTTDNVLNEFKKEIRTTQNLEHENILPIKDASFIEDRMVMVFPLGEETLLNRLQRRLSTETASISQNKSCVLPLTRMPIASSIATSNPTT